MKKVYESTGNVHIPELKCSAQKGTRVTVEDEMFTMNGVTIPMPQNFQILLKYDLFKELTEEEAETPERVEEPKVMKREERKKMRVEIAEDNKLPLVTAARVNADDAQIQEAETKVPGESETVRGMKIVKDETIPIVARKLESSEEKKESGVVVSSKSQVRPTAKKSISKGKPDKAAAEKLKAERIKKATASAEKSK